MFPPIMLRLKNIRKALKCSASAFGENVIKKEAWSIRKASVLIKKKISRRQYPRNRDFVHLMSLVAGSLDGAGDDAASEDMWGES